MKIRKLLTITKRDRLETCLRVICGVRRIKGKPRISVRGEVAPASPLRARGLKLPIGRYERSLVFRALASSHGRGGCARSEQQHRSTADLVVMIPAARVSGRGRECNKGQSEYKAWSAPLEPDMIRLRF
jgi:hypothetical protein